jgi:isoamylase
MWWKRCSPSEFVDQVCRHLETVCELYQDDGRQPFASINFVTCHDGFTLQDLVSYQDKHNQANGEDNRDGIGDSMSWNHGIEGPTDNAEIADMRNQQKRNFLATLLLSQGVPMLLAGDELGRTQNGNNNAYCQDNELSWLDWEHADTELINFVTLLIRLRRQHPAFQRRKWFKGREIWGPCAEDISWYQPSGESMVQADWSNESAKSLAVYLCGRDVDTDEEGRTVNDNDFYLALNAYHEPVTFRLPRSLRKRSWQCVLDTSQPTVTPQTPESPAGDSFVVPGRCLMLWESVTLHEGNNNHALSG